jgi:hypothetical protein
MFSWTRTQLGHFSLIFDTFSVQNQIKDQGFSYLLVTLGEKIIIKLFLVVSPHIVLCRFETKYKPEIYIWTLLRAGSGLEKKEKIRLLPGSGRIRNSLVTIVFPSATSYGKHSNWTSTIEFNHPWTHIVFKWSLSEFCPFTVCICSCCKFVCLSCSRGNVTCSSVCSRKSSNNGWIVICVVGDCIVARQ